MIVVMEFWSSWFEKVLHYAHVDLLIMSALMLVFIVALLHVYCNIAFERQRREEMDRQLLNALQRIKCLEDHPRSQPPASPVNFAHDLNHAELKNRLQAPASSGSAPDKYRHIASLVQQGMSVAQIADVLNLSLPEAHQLVALARIANRVD